MPPDVVVSEWIEDVSDSAGPTGARSSTSAPARSLLRRSGLQPSVIRKREMQITFFMRVLSIPNLKRLTFVRLTASQERKNRKGDAGVIARHLPV